MNSKRKIDILMKFIECINKADIECINALLSGDHIFIDLSGDIHKGKEEVNWEGYYELFPDYQINVNHLYERDEKLIIIGESEGNFSDYGLKVFTFNGQKPKKEDFQGRAIWIAIIKGDLIKEWQIYNDNKETRKKLNIPNEDQK